MNTKHGSAKRVCLGIVTQAHGIRGEVVVRTFTAMPEDIGAYGPLEDETGERRFTIVATRLAGKGLIVRLEGIAARNEAEALKGTRLHVACARLPEPEDGEWYHADLIGLAVMAEDGRRLEEGGQRLGEVVGVQNFGAGDLLEIRPATGGETVLVPFTEAAVPVVDVGGGLIVVSDPHGLFDSEEEKPARQEP